MKPILLAISISVVLVVGAIFLPKGSDNSVADNPPSEERVNNVYVENGVQVVDISVRGGYSPKKSFAESGIPTVLRMRTNGSLDCSSAVAVPSLNYRKNLPLTGITDIEVPSQVPGAVLQGMCAMGMYRFSVAFK